MLGLITVSPSARRPAFAQRRVLGAPFLFLTLPESLGGGGVLRRHRISRLAVRLRGEGVRCAVFPRGYSHAGLFARCGVLPVDTVPLCRTLAPQYVEEGLAARGVPPARAVVALSADRMTRSLADAVRTLALAYRYVLLDVPDGGQQLERELRRCCGISLLLQPTAQQLERADALLLFAPRTDLTWKNPLVLTLYPGGEVGEGALPLALPPHVSSAFPADVCPRQLAAALFSAGAVSAQALLGKIPG